MGAFVNQVGTEGVVAVLAENVRRDEYVGFSSLIDGNVYELEGLVTPRGKY